MSCTTSSPQWIDTHIHVITKSYQAAVDAAGGDPSGYPMPTWTEASCLEFMESVKIQRAILSVTAPGPSIAGNGAEGRKLARKMNDEVADIVRQYPDRMSYFASTPDWTDVQGTLDELDHIFNHHTKARAVGVVVMTSYGKRLLGDPLFNPIWDKLNAYKAIVFIHPSAVAIEPQFVSGNLPQPMIDYPHATTRTAVDLLFSGRFNACPDVDVILSHAGGELPFLAERALMAVRQGPFKASYDGCEPVDCEQVVRNMHRLYMDTALSGSSPQLEALLAFGCQDRILYGSDFPYAPVPTSKLNNSLLFDYVNKHGKRAEPVSPATLRRNAIQLFKKHGMDLE
ncbi:amidohydrolase 2 [Lichtheimia corymbifera JMRC:FSU:9682]|uniref:6-methylsalicylate decarboxylase n=1 Tax=Lichtheimia corymbifera JMRC:FSU:9682 TaxID=1263082 RepID=A0A068RSU3_9FUNG|nr:amidohydrolase 2 [Lichtheimia corymbifera JMRC:FSU:9682]